MKLPTFEFFLSNSLGGREGGRSETLKLNSEEILAVRINSEDSFFCGTKRQAW